ncbi:MAG TPA: S-layer homology domain-containing protein [Sedimentibacter sp.]|nr:S-layer homology domain-containing protein [Sedimentibacter sp.]
MMEKKTFKRVVSLVIALMMILSGIQVSFADTQPEDDITLYKKATPVEGEDNTYKIQLSVKGKDINTGKKVDVILVIDNSASMFTSKYNNQTLGKITEEAAKAFVAGVLTPENDVSKNVRVAVVRYGEQANARIFTGTGSWSNNWSDGLDLKNEAVYTYNKADAEDAIEKATNPTTNEGTNTESGFLMAGKVAEATRSDAESIVVFMTDGLPTYRYNDNNGTAVSDFYGNQTSADELNEAIAAAQELAIKSKIYTVGLLSAFKSTDAEVTLASNLLSLTPKNFIKSGYPVDNNRIIYYVNDSDRWSSTATYAQNYYPIYAGVNASEEMMEIYEGLAGDIYALANGDVTDIIPKDFDLTEDSEAELLSLGVKVTHNADGTTTLVFKDISAREKINNLTSYKVKVKSGIYGTGYTNVEAYYKFTLFGNTEESEPKYFPLPVVAINPTAEDDSGFSVFQGETLAVEIGNNILKNDKTVKLDDGDYEVNDLAVAVDYVKEIDTEKGGKAVLSADGTFVYTPPSDYTGIDTFKYKNTVRVEYIGVGTDEFKLAGDYFSNEATVTIMVNPVVGERIAYKIQHLVQESNEVLLEESGFGYEGDEITAHAKEFEGYVLAPEEADEKTLTLSAEGNNTIIFWYVEESVPVNKIPYTVQYRDKGTEEKLAVDKVGYGKPEQTVTEYAIPIDGYTPTEEEQTFVIDKENKIIVFWYVEESVPVNKIPYTVQYRDKGTEEKLAVDKVGYGKPEQTVTEYAIPIDGYTPTEEEQTFVIDEENIIIVFWYEKDTAPIESNVIIVKHYTQSGSAAKVLKQTDAPIPVTTSATIKGENFKITISGHTFESSTPKEIDVYARVTSESAIQFIFELLYKKDSSGPGPGPGPGGNGGTVIKDNPVPLAELEKKDHFAYIIGYPEGDVRPLNNITREEVAMIFYRLLTDDSRNQLLSDVNPFTDMDAYHKWSNRAVSTLYNAGILSGYPDGTFKPSAPITRAEFATIAAKFDDLDLLKATQFTDIFGHWAEKYITSSENKGWIKGYPDMTFKPNQDITRAEAMTLINNVLERKTPAENIHADAIFWPDNPKTQWYYEAVMEATNSHEYIYEEDGDELWTGMKPNKVWP